MAEVRRVRFEYCISLVFLTLHRESENVALEPGQRAWMAGLPYCAISMLLGWWGLPWGVFLTPVVLYRNLCGGLVVFDDLPVGVDSERLGPAVSTT